MDRRPSRNPRMWGGHGGVELFEVGPGIEALGAWRGLRLHGPDRDEGRGFSSRPPVWVPRGNGGTRGSRHCGRESREKGRGPVSIGPGDGAGVIRILERGVPSLGGILLTPFVTPEPPPRGRGVGRLFRLRPAGLVVRAQARVPKGFPKSRTGSPRPPIARLGAVAGSRLSWALLDCGQARLPVDQPVSVRQPP